MPQELDALGQRYVRSIRKRFGVGKRFVDKTMQSCLLLPAILEALPDARVVLVARDHRAVLFSMYENLFRQGVHRYTYSFDDLAHFYAGFQSIVSFWQSKEPDRFVIMSYEALVMNQYRTTRLLLDSVESLGLMPAWNRMSLTGL